MEVPHTGYNQIKRDGLWPKTEGNIHTYWENRLKCHQGFTTSEPTARRSWREAWSKIKMIFFELKERGPTQTRPIPVINGYATRARYEAGSMPLDVLIYVWDLGNRTGVKTTADPGNNNAKLPRPLVTANKQYNSHEDDLGDELITIATLRPCHMLQKIQH